MKGARTRFRGLSRPGSSISCTWSSPERDRIRTRGLTLPPIERDDQALRPQCRSTDSEGLFSNAISRSARGVGTREPIS